ncbi:MAG: protein kinase [bacterium]
MTGASLTAALSDRYRVEREIGVGGMATVYLAEDLKHHRKVAVKVLRQELSAALGHERFLREISTTASLRHPHILPLYDSGEADGSIYYVMPFVDGESLRQRLDRERQLPIDDALRIAREVADALSYAHTKGVIHRDIKPDNILLEHGHAIVADFGIARAMTVVAGDRLTQTGMAIGTPKYMSPEQSFGDIDLDGRSDLYSLGCVLYEMLAGEPPYSGPTALAIIAKRMMEPVPRISIVRETVGPALESALIRTLAKAPADRFATANEFVEALRNSESVAPARDDTASYRIGVVAFRTSGIAEELRSIAEGLSEEIATGLSRFSYLRVVKGTAPLGARYLMDGTFRQVGNRLRIAIQLVDTSSASRLWTETFERAFTPEATFELQDEITDRVVATIADPNGVLVRSMSSTTASKPPLVLAPYEAVLRFFLYQQRVTEDDHLAARLALEHAVELDPGYADAWAAYSLVILDEDRHLFNPQPDALDRALHAAERAVDSDPANQLARYALAVTYYFRGDMGAFGPAAERALALNSRDVNTMAFLGILFCYSGDWERGLPLTTRAMELNPNHPDWYRFATFFDAYRQRRYSEALAIVQGINLPEYFAMHYTVAIAQAQLGNLSAARAAAQRTLQLWPEFEREFLTGQVGKWMSNQPDLLDHIIEGLKLAGLRVRRAEDVNN